MSDVIDAKAIGTVPLPSADLINYRFDQNDKNMAELKKESTDQFDKLNNKIDQITSTFATVTYVTELKTDSDKAHQDLQTQISNNKTEVNTKFKDVRNFTRWCIGTLLVVTAIGVSIVAIIVQNNH